MAKPQKVIPSRVVLDLDQTRFKEDMASFKRNILFNSAKNGSGVSGSNLLAETPFEGTAQLSELAHPEEANLTIGWFEAKEVNEGYAFVWNVLGQHFIKRINGSDGTEEIVYQGECLNFQLDPQYFINETRCTLEVIQKRDKVTEQVVTKKFLVFTDNFNPQRFIAVDDSIATNSFNATDHPYFAVGGAACDPCHMISLGLDTPYQCIAVEKIKRTAQDKTKQNLLIHRGWQFRVKYIDVWGRVTEHGIISDRHFIVFGSNCILKSSGLPRCFKLTFDIGCPTIDKIQIEYRNCVDNTRNLSNDSDWVLYDTLEKYENCDDDIQWWERDIRNPYQDKYDEFVTQYVIDHPDATQEEIDEAAAIATYGLTKYVEDDNTFEYTFCGDKGCQPLPIKETIRLSNPIPRTSASVFPINKGIALANNMHGFEPINCDVLEGIDYTVESTEEGDCNMNDLRKIEVYAVIFNPARYELGRIFQMGPVHFFSFVTHQTVNTSVNFTNLNLRGNAQMFVPGYKNFICYLAGTKYYAIGKQVFIVAGVEYDDELDIPTGTLPADIIYLQKFTFDVSPGKYVARLASHRTTIKDEYQKTSTFVAGHTDIGSIGQLTSYTSREIIVDVCENDYSDREDLLCIFDYTDQNALHVTSGLPYMRGISGYLMESAESDIPIELAPFVCMYAGDQIGHRYTSLIWYPIFTDHNGFFHYGSGIARTHPTNVGPGTTCNTTYNALVNRPGLAIVGGGFFGFSVGCGENIAVSAFQQIDTKLLYTETLFNYTFEYYESYYYPFKDDANFPANKKRTIKGRLQDCDDENIGIPGQPVVMLNGPVVYTNNDGEFTMIAHDRYDPYPDDDTLVLTQRGECYFRPCEDPCDCFGEFTVPYLDCSGSRLHEMATIEGTLIGANIGGPQTGGRYGIGIAGWDEFGRCGFINMLDKHYLDIPSLVKQQSFSFSNINFTIDPNTVFPSWVKRISFFITKNLNHDDFMMWVADKVELVDEGGTVNKTNPKYIRIYYESLNEYNKQNGFATNSAWEIFESEDEKDSNTRTRLGDWIEFIINGNGDWFQEHTKSLIRYDKEGKFFTIDYMDELKELEEGALYRLVRPRSCETEPLFYEMCSMIDINQTTHKATVTSGRLPYTDSYMLQRSVPVPTVIETESPDTADESIYTTINIVKYYPYFFEHPSPSDFWGDHCTSRGRVNIKNPYEQERYMEVEIAPSKTLLSNGSFNGLSYFDNEDFKQLTEMDAGYITAVLPEINRLLVICKRDSFIVPYADNVIRLDEEGRATGGTTSIGMFGKPQKAPGESFGCNHYDVNTIRRRNGVVCFLDSSREAFVFHNYQKAQDVSFGNGYKSWIANTVASQRIQNSESEGAFKWFFHCGIDPKGDHVYLTSFVLPQPNIAIPLDEPEELVIGEDDEPAGPPVEPLQNGTYINNQDSSVIGLTDTIVIDLLTGQLRTFASCTPEYYGALEGFFRGKNFFSFKEAVSWSHHNNPVGLAVNNFYGIQCPKVFSVIYNLSPEKEKRYLWTEVYCKEHKFIVTKVITESGQQSRILAGNWQKRDTFFAADFKCNVNTVFDPATPARIQANPLLDGETLYGRWAEVTYKSEAGDDAKYCEVSAVVAYLMPGEKSAD
jgi:hypothetical protein